MNRLIVSIIIRIGIRGVGVPSGRRCPSASVGWFRMPIMTVANQRGNARPMLRDNCVVGVKVYGSNPSMFKEIKNNIKEARRTAHLCPGRFTGVKSSRVNRLINQLWSVRSRLFSHRVEGVGRRSHGRDRARAIRGMPNSIGLINWSKKLSVMVSFRALL